MVETQSDEPKAPRSIFSSVSLHFAGQFFVVLLSAISAVLLGRLLGPGGKGQVNTVLTGVGILTLAFEFGFSVASIRFIAARQLSWKESLATLAFLYGMVCLVLLPGGWWLLTRFGLGGIALPVLLLALVAVPLSLIVNSVRSALAGQQRLPEVSGMQTVERFTVIIGMVAFLLILHWSVYGAVLAALAGFLVSTLFGLWLLWRLPSTPFRIRFDIIPELGRFSRMVYVSGLANTLNYRLDAILVFALLGEVSAGLYATAVGLGEMAQYLPNSVAVVLFPNVSSDVVDAEKRTARLSRATVLILVLSCAMLALLGRPLLAIFGPRFVDGYHALLLLLPGMIALGQGRLMAVDLSGRGHPQYAALTAWIALICTVVLDMLLIPPQLTFGTFIVPTFGWGINGAAIASSIAYSIMALSLFIIYRRLTGVGFHELYLPRADELLEMAGRLRNAFIRVILRKPVAEE